MDTRFWGPPCWILLHSLAEIYTPSQKSTYKLFFNNLKNVLPCIYCRVSFTEYTEALPIDGFLGSKQDLCNWLYKIHNMVNNKLRNQGLIHTPDPSLESVIEKYKNIVNDLDTCKTREQSIMAWNFLYCVAFVIPVKSENISTAQYNGYIIFFNELGKILPKKGGIARIYRKYLEKCPIMNAIKSREKLKGWVYNLEKFFDRNLNVKCRSFLEIENEIESYRAGCGGLTNDKRPTCRRIKK